MGGFYYDPGDREPEDRKPGMRDALALTIAVFQTLALPLAFILGVVIALVGLLWLFFFNALAAGIVLLLVILAIVARGVWEARNPPKLP